MVDHGKTVKTLDSNHDATRKHHKRSMLEQIVMLIKLYILCEEHKYYTHRCKTCSQAHLEVRGDGVKTWYGTMPPPAWLVWSPDRREGLRSVTGMWG